MVTRRFNTTVIPATLLETVPRLPPWHSGSTEVRKLIGTPMKAKKPSRIDVLPERMRRKRVWVVRRQLQQGRYDIDSRLAAVLDRVLEDVSV
jgi:hypothetical protein